MRLSFTVLGKHEKAIVLEGEEHKKASSTTRQSNKLALPMEIFPLLFLRYQESTKQAWWF